MKLISAGKVFTVVLTAAAMPAFAGEFVCEGGKCPIDTLQPSQWKPTACHEPAMPNSSKVASAADFDAAADKFNQWTADSKTYMACVAKEATADAASAQDAIVKASKELQAAQVAALETERKSLEAKRPTNTDTSKSGSGSTMMKAPGPSAYPNGY